MNIGARVPVLWLDTFFGPKWPKCGFQAPDLEIITFFQNFLIFLYSYYDSGENEVLFCELEPGFQTYGLLRPLGLSCPKPGFRPHTPNVASLKSKKFFMSSSITFCMNQVLIFKIWVNFHKISVYFQKIANLFNSYLKNPLFWRTKIKISPEPLSQILKVNPI